jgi:hypothetical protein
MDVVDVVDVVRELDVDGSDVVFEPVVDVDEAPLGVADVLLSFGDGGSSSSESELSAGDGAPVVDGLLPGESGLSGPSSALPGPSAPRPASCRFVRIVRTGIGEGRRRW